MEKEKLVEIIETKAISLKGFTFIEGFPGLGLAGTIGARYLVDKLKFEQIGFIDSKLLLPVIRIENGVPVHPIRLYASRKNKVVVAIAEQIIGANLTSPMAEELVEWIKKKGIKRVISSSGVRIPEGKSVYAFASDENSKKIIKKNGITIIENGITSGVTALLMLKLKDNKIEAFCVLGNAKSSSDYNAAAEVVKVICKILGIAIEVTPLIEDAKKLEQMILSHLKTVEETRDIHSDSAPMYA